MTTRMSDAESWAKDWMTAAALCKAMASAWPEYVRLAAMPSTELDGYGAGGGGETRSKGTHSDSPAAIALRKDEWGDAEEDRVASLVGRLYGESASLIGTVRRIAGLKRLIDNRGDARYGRQSSVADCLCCEVTVTGLGEDRLKAGYCPRCHRAWCRYRDAEQLAGRDPVQEMFRRQHRAEHTADEERAS